MVLSDTTHKYEIVLAGAATSLPVDIVCAYSDIDTSATATETVRRATQVSTSNGTTAATILSSPAAGIDRRVDSLVIHNTDTGAVTATIRLNVSGTYSVLRKSTMQIGDTLTFTPDSGWTTMDSSGQVRTSGAAGTGRLLRAPQYITSGTTYSTPAGCTAIEIEAVGGGGGGGGGDTGGSNASVGGGGAAGAYARKYYTVTGSTTYTVAIGAAGAAGAATSAADGGTGGDTTFTDGVTLVTAKGGLGGVGQAAGTSDVMVLGGLGVISTNGDVNTAGAPGTYARRTSGTVGISGAGGSGPFGSGGNSRMTHGAGVAGLGRGSGGGGCCGLNGAAAQTGGAGTAGLIIVHEYA